MNMVFYDSQGRVRNSTTIEDTVDALWKLKKSSGKNPWPVIEEIIQIFQVEYPQRWKSYLINIKDIRETRKDPKFGSSTDKTKGSTQGAILRYTLDIPVKIHEIIRGIYSPQELNMNRQFWLEFARRYPIFKVAERL